MSVFHSGRNRQWAKVRRHVLNDENWKCRFCHGYGNEVDHIVAMSRGGKEYDRDNLQVLCRSCHIEKTRKERGGKRLPPTGAKAWDYFVATNINIEKVKL